MTESEHPRSEEAHSSSERPILKPNGTSDSSSTVHPFVKFLRSTFGYRKTTLTLFIVLTFVATLLVSHFDNDLEASVQLPGKGLEYDSLNQAWLDLQNIGRYEHSYGSSGNDYVHDYLEDKIVDAIKTKDYIEYDNDLNYTNNILFNTPSSNPHSNVVSYYESNNLVVRINGSNPKLPALLLSAHYDSVPSSFGITDDGMGIASLLGVVYYYSAKKTVQPERTLIFNFNNNEEFGLYGAKAFLQHPWFKQIKYFLNLEGTGAGGKALLFRSTDYGILKFFKNVRYPYGNSVFQQIFNNKLIHSETDYKIYKEEGNIRGLDLFFYKPRDIYHTTRDDIKSVNIKSLWHMLSNSLDFVAELQGKVDLDSEYEKLHDEDDPSSGSLDFAAYFSFYNYFFALPLSKSILLNIILLVLVPLVSLPLLVVIFNYKHSWNVTVVNVLKFPVSFILSSVALNVFVESVVSNNQFLINSSFRLIVLTSISAFLLLNYAILNGLNLLFSGYRVTNHDEKLIVLIEISFITWVGLLWTTLKLSSNKIGDDHTGESSIALLFILQSIGALLGLLGWSLKESKIPVEEWRSDESAQPLLRHHHRGDYGSNGQEYEGEGRDEDILDESSSLSFEEPKKESKSFSYDWSIQFLLVVPLSSYIIYNSGFFVLDGLNKTVQESLKSEKLLYEFVQYLVLAWSIPFLPFIFKFNKLIVLILIISTITGSILIQTTDAFDQLNPLKLRFLQSINLNDSTDSYVRVTAREHSPLKAVLEDIPSLKESGETVKCTPLGDGIQECSFKSTIPPKFGAHGAFPITTDLVNVTILKNSSANNDYPFGLLSGEIAIQVPKNRECNLKFNVSDSTTKLIKSKSDESPVKTFIFYADHKKSNKTEKSYGYNTIETALPLAIPEGFSKDKEGNYIFKLSDGINQIQLNKLGWDKDYHLGFQWIPSLVDSESIDIASVLVHKLGIQVDCYWGDFTPVSDEDHQEKSLIPAFNELIHFSPNYVSWANRERGLVVVSKYVEI